MLSISNTLFIYTIYIIRIDTKQMQEFCRPINNSIEESLQDGVGSSADACKFTNGKKSILEQKRKHRSYLTRCYPASNYSFGISVLNGHGSCKYGL
jgi:hypothetical protein